MPPGSANARRQGKRLVPLENILLDFDGVINDMERMMRQSHLAIAEGMVTEHGGDLKQWLGALERAAAAADQWAPESPLRNSDVVRWLREYDRVWLEELFAAGGIRPPAEGKAELGWHIREEAYGKIDSVYPDVPKALPLLKRGGRKGNIAGGIDGRTLYIASGGRKARLEVMSRKAGLRDYFRELFGCDTVNALKESPEYYRRIFDRLGASPSLSLTVDDNPKCIAWAQEAGARAALLDRKGQDSSTDADFVASDLFQLARALKDTASRADDGRGK